MNDTNPYETPGEHSQAPSLAVPSQLKARWAVAGFLLGAALPVGYGIYGLQQHVVYTASLAPGEGACGMGALAAAMMICVVGPFCGAIGAASGWTAAMAKLWAAR